MSEANDIGPTSQDVGSNALKAGREADGLKRIGEAAPAKAGRRKASERKAACLACGKKFGRWEQVWRHSSRCNGKSASASVPAFPTADRRATEKEIQND